MSPRLRDLPPSRIILPSTQARWLPAKQSDRANCMLNIIRANCDNHLARNGRPTAVQGKTHHPISNSLPKLASWFRCRKPLSMMRKSKLSKVRRPQKKKWLWPACRGKISQTSATSYILTRSLNACRWLLRWLDNRWASPFNLRLSDGLCVSLSSRMSCQLRHSVQQTSLFWMVQGKLPGPSKEAWALGDGERTVEQKGDFPWKLSWFSLACCKAVTQASGPKEIVEYI